MDRFDRQTRIRGWRQELFQQATVAVYGRSWTGCFAVWALANLGVGSIAWIGLPHPATNGFANWLLADPCPIPGCLIVDYPHAVEYGLELAWVLEARPVNALVDCGEDSVGGGFCLDYAAAHTLRFFSGTTAQGGWMGSGLPPDRHSTQSNPVTAMLLAALLADAVRESICPLFSGRRPREGRVALETPAPQRRGTIALVGVGGIGVYAATLAALSGYDLWLVDLDRVEETNLNRQGLFTAEDAARGAYKAEAAARSLGRLFPTVRISACVGRVDRDFKQRLAALKPALLLSAVDNAATRLVLQSFGRELALPVIQGGTDVFAADCFCQEVQGSPLDDQMYGALSEAAAREKSQPRRHGTCAVDPSYVVPGMICGGLLIHRMIQALEQHRGLGPIRWRTGELPKEQSPSLPHEFTFETCHLN